VTIGATIGTYTGQPAGRRYLVRIHWDARPSVVTAGDSDLAAVPSRDVLDSSPSGWYHDPSLGGVTVVKTPPVPANAATTITLDVWRSATDGT
jgi:hypothetical protein